MVVVFVCFVHVGGGVGSRSDWSWLTVGVGHVGSVCGVEVHVVVGCSCLGCFYVVLGGVATMEIV